MSDTPLPLPSGIRLTWKIPITMAVTIILGIAWDSYSVGAWKDSVDRRLTAVESNPGDHDLLQRLDERSATTLAAIADVKAAIAEIKSAIAQNR